MNYPLVSVISVIYNQIDVTIDFLHCVFKLTYPNLEVILVDNASQTDYSDLIKSQFPGVKYIRSEDNLGFAGGNNLGIEKSKGDILFFVNNDTEFAPDILEPMVKKLVESKEIGIISPKIKFYGTNLIQYGGYDGINKYTGRAKTNGKAKVDDGSYDFIKEASFAIGTAMMVPRRVINEVGPMPNIYFLYYEELDWSEMIKKHGYKILYFGKVTINHKESISVGKKSKLKMYYLTRNRLLFYRRNLKGLNLLSTLSFYVFLSFPINFFRLIMKGDWGLISAFLKGVSWNLFHYNIKN